MAKTKRRERKLPPVLGTVLPVLHSAHVGLWKTQRKTTSGPLHSAHVATYRRLPLNWRAILDYKAPEPPAVKPQRKRKERAPNAAFFIHTNGTVRIEAKKPAFKEMQRWCGGYVQTLAVQYEGRACTMVMDEEGRLNGKQVANHAASLIVAESYRQGKTVTIMGNVVILRGYKL